MPAARLGLRMVRGNDLALRLRSILTAIGAAICVLLVMGILGAWHVGRVAEQRNIAQAAHPDPHGTLLYFQVADRWHGAELSRTYLAADDANAPIPPGLPRLPIVGEVALSPSLAASLRAGDEELRARFGGMKVLIIGRAGLTSQSEQLAYVGASATQLRGAQRVSSFGDALQITQTSARLRLLSLLLFIVFVGVPYAGMCAVATRLGADARRRRLAALWMIGVPPRQLRLAAAVEASVAVLVGGVVGIATYGALRPIVATHVSVSGIRPFAADLGLSVLLQAAVLVAVVVVAIVSGTLLGGSNAWRGTRPTRVSRRFAGIPLVLLPIGLGLALATAKVIARAPGSSMATVLLDLTAAVLVVGASLSLAFLVQRAGGLMARSLPSGSALLAARRLESDPGAMARLGAVILPAVFGIGFAATIATQFHLSDSAARAEASFHGRQLAVIQAPALPGARLDTHGVTPLASVPVVPASAGPDVIIASCAQLRRLSGQPALRCPAGRYVLDVADPLGGGPSVSSVPTPEVPPAHTRQSNTVVLRSVTGESLTLRYPSTKLRMELATQYGAFRVVLIPPNDPALARSGELPVRQMMVAVPSDDAAAVRGLRSSVALRNPLAEVDLAGENELAANAGYSRYGTTALLLAIVACVVGAAGVAITAVDAVLTRRRRLEPLLVLGVPRAALRRATAAEIVTPLVVAVLLGAGIAMLCGALFVRRNSTVAHLAVPAISLSALIGVGVAVLVAMIAVVLVPATPSRVSAYTD